MSFKHLVTDINGIYKPGSLHVVERKLIPNSWGLLIIFPGIFVVFCSILQHM